MSGDDVGTRNTVRGGTQHIVLQGRDFRDVNITTVQPAAAPVALAQLPAPVAGFTGRETELAEITRLLDPAAGIEAVVVSAVAGLAGVGKTALAIQGAHVAETAGWFSGGLLFLDLHGYDEQPIQPGQALDGLLRALGVLAQHIPPGIDERAALYRSALAQITKPVLVIADNASAEAQVQPLLPGRGPHRVLITSRHTLAGLGARLLDVEVLDEQTAIALLEQVLRAGLPGDGRISSDPEAAQRLAAVCGGLPLALRITAALLAADRTLTAAELAGQLADEISRLHTLHYDDGSGTSAPSVAAAFDLSYRHLDEVAARLFRLLPVNPGLDVSAAAAAALTGEPAGATRAVLGRLARAHLAEPTGAGRWRMHDLLRLYARQLADTEADAQDLEQARDRLLDYYLGGLRAGDAHLRALPGTPVPAGFSGREEALAWLDAERPSLIAAAVMAARTGRDQYALHLPLNLSQFLDWRRRFDDMLTVLAISRDTARRLGDRTREAIALGHLGNALVQVRRYEEAVTACQDAATIYRLTGDRHREGGALTNLGIALDQVQRYEEAIIACQDAATIFRENGDRHREGVVLNNLGLVLQEVRRFDEGIIACQEAATIFQGIGDRYSEGQALSNLGLALQEVRRFKQAIIAYNEAATIFRETGDRHGEGQALNNLGNALGQLGRSGEAIIAHQEADSIFRETGDRHREGMVLDNLGLVLAEVGRFEEAITAHQEAATIFQETGGLYGEGQALNDLGLVLAEVGRFGEAITACRKAASIFREIGDRHREGGALNKLGLALAEVGRFEEAIIACREAAAIYRGDRDEDSENIALNNLKDDQARKGR